MPFLLRILPKTSLELDFGFLTQRSGFPPLHIALGNACSFTVLQMEVKNTPVKIMDDLHVATSGVFIQLDLSEVGTVRTPLALDFSSPLQCSLLISSAASSTLA